MNTNDLPEDVRRYVNQALDKLGITLDKLGFWEVSDYGIFVLMTESFYKSLNYRRAEPEDFYARRIVGKLPYRGSYRDSRAYMLPVLRHFFEHGIDPAIMDVGGYIGRFSIEQALMARESGRSLPITCFEPGLTAEIIKANLALNGVAEYVSVREEAVSDTEGFAEYKYAPDVLISGRICSFPSAKLQRTVPTVRLDSVLSRLNCRHGAIIKVDTEGHEPAVMQGLGLATLFIPMVLIVEFWPATLQESVDGLAYADYIEKNFVVINIRSSLYPMFFTLVDDIRRFAREFNVADGNVDLLFVSRTMPGLPELVESLCSLAR